MVSGMSTTNIVCYMLQEKGAGLQPLRRPRSYKGYTTNLPRRLRQHNGEIKGGARYTRSFRGGVALKAFVSGFPSKRVALSYEWYSKRRLLSKAPAKKLPHRSCAAGMVTMRKNMLRPDSPSVLRLRDERENLPHRALWTFLAPLAHPKFAAYIPDLVVRFKKGTVTSVFAALVREHYVGIRVVLF